MLVAENAQSVFRKSSVTVLQSERNLVVYTEINHVFGRIRLGLDFYHLPRPLKQCSVMGTSSPNQDGHPTNLFRKKNH